ncbi:putative integral membrane protein [Cryptosporidium meleagridis]|uniref:Putative integral membrane protein n=1 Tax=Cryptosporidium meleagridis TaxID=93969 RepID=A0A2P4YWR4_9CRYT|nr:putative integral membrane protein [Cryptosporidium meleagridis]
MRLNNALYGFSLYMVFIFFLGDVTGIHINRELQNLSIESEGNIKVGNFAADSGDDDVNDKSNSNVKGEEEKNNDQGLTVNNTESGNGTTTGNMNDKNETVSQNTTELDNNNASQKYHIYNGTLNLKSTFFMDGIAYNSTTGLPILPKLLDKLDDDYDFDDMPVLKEALEIEVGWIIIGVCLALLAIMIITIIIVSVIKHRNNRARREAE